MSNALFYLLEHENEPGQIPAHFAYACQLAAHHYSQGQKVFISTDDRQHAFLVDEFLWQFDGDSFVPHNLMGEGPRYGSPVEISWGQPKQRRQVLINLRNTAPEFATQFTQVVDFVPKDESLKTLARQRYATYRKMGIQLATQALDK